jgi:hypothetical protein
MVHLAAQHHFSVVLVFWSAALGCIGFSIFAETEKRFTTNRMVSKGLQNDKATAKNRTKHIVEHSLVRKPQNVANTIRLFHRFTPFFQPEMIGRISR